MEEPITVHKTQGKNDSSKKGLKLTKHWLKIVFGLLLLAAIAAAAFYYKQYRDVRSNPGEIVQERNAEETQRVLTKLKAVLRIDETEAPTVARVDDPGKLKQTNEEFYKNVEQGDYLILYPKRAILFRETNSQIINLAPIINTSDLQPKSDDTSGSNNDQ